MSLKTIGKYLTFLVNALLPVMGSRLGLPPPLEISLQSSNRRLEGLTKGGLTQRHMEPPQKICVETMALTHGETCEENNFGLLIRTLHLLVQAWTHRPLLPFKHRSLDNKHKDYHIQENLTLPKL